MDSEKLHNLNITGTPPFCDIEIDGLPITNCTKLTLELDAEHRAKVTMVLDLDVTVVHIDGVDITEVIGLRG
jgi:hypothetical protein